jgi:hypothetical protein
MYEEPPSITFNDQSEERITNQKRDVAKKVSSLPVFSKYLNNRKRYEKDLLQTDFRADETSYKKKIMKKD